MGDPILASVCQDVFLLPVYIKYVNAAECGHVGNVGVPQVQCVNAAERGHIDNVGAPQVQGVNAAERGHVGDIGAV